MPLPARSLSPSLPLLREQRYRRQFLREDGRQSAIVLGVVAAAYVVAARNDLAQLQGIWLGLSLASRGLLLAVTVPVLVLLRRATWPRQQERALLLGLGAIAIAVSGIHLIKLSSGRILGPIMASGALVAFLYFAQRGPVLPRAIVASLIVVEAVALILLGNHEAFLDGSARLTGVLGLGGMNVVGIFSARAFEQQRRKRFDAERHERHARQELAARLRELAIEKERAEAMSRARTAFLAAMSHEFRTPMNAVIGLSDLLLDAPLAPEHGAHVRAIHESARALLLLLNEILDFAKIDAQKLTLSLAPFDLPRLATSVADMLRPAAESRSIELSLTISPGVPAGVLGDEARLRQVLVNLVSNAVKFTERGAVRLAISSCAREGSDREITFQVKDSGIGIAPEVLTRLFRPFEQADAGRTRRHGGTGLGLAISKQIVQAMGGDIHVESDPGRGSVFSFTLRLTEAVLPAEQARALPVHSAARSSLAILVVDDLPINQHVARAMLARLGNRADVVSGGGEALRAVTQRSYDVVLMDLQMPEMSGIEATLRLREQLAGGRAPVIVAMTASVLEEDRDACQRAGMRHFLGKPLEPSELERVLDCVAKEYGLVQPDPATERTSRSRADTPVRERAGLALVGAEASDIVHELNQPLAAGMLNAETALELLGRPTPDVAAARELLQRIAADYGRAGLSLRRLRSALQREGAHEGSAHPPDLSPPLLP